MRKMIVFCLLLSVSGTTFSQDDTVTSDIMQAEYLKKSKSQKTIAWVMAGAGFTLTGIGSIILLSDLGNIFKPDNSFHDRGNIGSVVALTGMVSMVGSIPLFINASHNKHKAILITFNNDFVPQAQGNLVIKKPVEEISLAFKF